jgi:hypothetical protein
VQAAVFAYTFAKRLVIPFCTDDGESCNHLAQLRIGNTDDYCFDHSFDFADHFFDLGRTDSNSGRLDLFVGTPDEIDVPIRVSSNQVAGPNTDF